MAAHHGDEPMPGLAARPEMSLGHRSSMSSPISRFRLSGMDQTEIARAEDDEVAGLGGFPVGT
jgi:hypothetical protein